MVHFGEFLKPEVCGQTVLPDRSVLIGQNWWKMRLFRVIFHSLWNMHEDSEGLRSITTFALPE